MAQAQSQAITARSYLVGLIDEAIGRGEIQWTYRPGGKDRHVLVVCSSPSGSMRGPDEPDGMYEALTSLEQTVFKQ